MVGHVGRGVFDGGDEIVGALAAGDVRCAEASVGLELLIDGRRIEQEVARRGAPIITERRMVVG